MGGGTPFPVGASVTDAESLGCEGVAGTLLLTFHQAQLSGDGVTYEIIDTGYTRDGDNLVVYGDGPQTTNSPTLPPVDDSDRLPRHRPAVAAPSATPASCT